MRLKQILFCCLILKTQRIQTNSELMNSEAVEYLEPVEYDSSTKLQYQDEYSQQQSYSAQKGKNVSDIIVPVPSVEE